MVAEAERERSPQPVLREHARGVAWRRRVLVLRHPHQSDRRRDRRSADRPQARLRRRRFELVARRLVRPGRLLRPEQPDPARRTTRRFFVRSCRRSTRRFRRAETASSPSTSPRSRRPSLMLSSVSSVRRTGTRTRRSPFFRARPSRPTSRRRLSTPALPDRRSGSSSSGRGVVKACSGPTFSCGKNSVASRA